MKLKKLKPEELEQVRAFETLLSQKLQELGIASYEEVTARSKVIEITEDLSQTAQKKNEYYNELRQLYGDGIISLAEGTFEETTSDFTE